MADITVVGINFGGSTSSIAVISKVSCIVVDILHLRIWDVGYLTKDTLERSESTLIGFRG